MKKKSTKTSSQSRRQFILDSAKMACGVGFLGVGLGLYTEQSSALPETAIRPPGALPEDEFLGACIRCGLCVRECDLRMRRLAEWSLKSDPSSSNTGTVGKKLAEIFKPTAVAGTTVLKLAQPQDPVATGTPYFLARTGPCEMCQHIPCVVVCPTGALDHELIDINEARMGLAVLIDQETCLNYLGLRCDVCYRECPLIDKAITLEHQHNVRTGKHALFIPTVHSDACTGCGICEKVCILTEAAIKIVPTKLAKGQIGEHYRMGWEEKAKAGKSLIDDQNIITMPTRMPKGMSAPGGVIDPALQNGDPPLTTIPTQPFGSGGAPASIDELLQQQLPTGKTDEEAPR